MIGVLAEISGKAMQELEVQFSQFPCGETQVKLNLQDFPALQPEDSLRIIVFFSYTSDVDLMRLALIQDALHQAFGMRLITKLLTTLYFPYSRQDRVCAKGESSSLKKICETLHSVFEWFDGIELHDPHSDVLQACLPSSCELQIRHVEELITRFDLSEYDCVVSPDAGAYKKIFKVAQVLGKPVMIANKVRDTSTGEITGTTVYAGDDEITDKKLLIVDDLCDGGRTFYELAKVLKQRGASKVGLYVTHGMFTKGLESMSEFIDAFYAYYTLAGESSLQETTEKPLINYYKQAMASDHYNFNTEQL